MSTFRLNLLFSGVDFDDDDVFGALAALPHILWRAQGDVAHATAFIEAGSAIKAAETVTRQVSEAVPAARPLAIDEDLVAIPDIASRVGMSREAVRNWANGRRHAGFPLPRGVVGDGIRVWAWSDINAWLQSNLSLGDSEHMPTQREIAFINAIFQEAHSHRSPPPSLTWNVASQVSTSQETTVARRFATSGWRRSDTREQHLEVIGGGLHAAA